MAGRGSVMYERVAFLRLEKLSHIGRADFHFQRCRHAIEGLYPLAGQILPMLVQVDESRRDHEAGRVDNTPTLQRRMRNSRDPSLLNPNITHSIGLGFRVNDASALDHDVVLLGHQERSAEQAGKAQKQLVHEELRSKA